MALNNDDQKRIRKYLLGHLTEAEQEAIEERIFTDDDFSEELEVSKDEVIEEYYAGGLRRKEREWLEQHLLASPEGRQRYRLAVALDHLNPPATKSSLIEPFQELWRRQPWAIAAVASTVIVILVAVTITRREQLRPVVAVTLTNSTYIRSRDSAPPEYEVPPPQVTKVTLPPNAGELRLTLKLPEPATADAQYRVELVDVIEAVPVAQQDANTVTVLIPATKLPRDDYAVRLYRVSSDGSEERIPGNYFFNVE